MGPSQRPPNKLKLGFAVERTPIATISNILTNPSARMTMLASTQKHAHRQITP